MKKGFIKNEALLILIEELNDIRNDKESLKDNIETLESKKPTKKDAELYDKTLNDYKEALDKLETKKDKKATKKTAGVKKTPVEKKETKKATKEVKEVKAEIKKIETYVPVIEVPKGFTKTQSYLLEVGNQVSIVETDEKGNNIGESFSTVVAVIPNYIDDNDDNQGLATVLVDYKTGATDLLVLNRIKGMKYYNVEGDYMFNICVSSKYHKSNKQILEMNK